MKKKTVALNQESKIFIGCSVENLEYAEFIQTQLQHIGTIQIWNQGIFKSGDYTLETLLEVVRNFDFGIFLVLPNDIATVRGKRILISRDNVLFEAGIFFSQLGRKRTILVVPNKTKSEKIDFHLPSDLNGLTLIKYHHPQKIEDLPAKLGAACSEIKVVVKELGSIDDDKIKVAIDSLSGGLLYVLRHVNKRIVNLDEAAKILAHFNSKNSPTIAWNKAAKYALQSLTMLNLIELQSINECSITKLGSQLLLNEKLQLRFPREISKQLLD